MQAIEQGLTQKDVIAALNENYLSRRSGYRVARERVCV
jgi:hypothetical protein